MKGPSARAGWLAGFVKGLEQTASLACLCACLSCEFPLSASKYEVLEPSPERSLEPSPERSLEPPEQRLLAAFAQDDPACVAELESKCPANLRRCAETSGCVEFTECVREQATPAAETNCSDLLGPSLETRWSYESLRACWAERHAICSVGNDFRCAGQYETPHAERSHVTLSHAIRYFEQPERPNDFLVRICGFLSDCSSPLQEVALDASGTYTVNIPVAADPGRPGSAWAGYRLVESPRIQPSRIESNVPIWGARTEVTRVLDNAQQELLAGLFAEARPHAVFVQVLDCQSAPAAGVTFELPLSKTGTVLYVKGIDAKVTDGTGAASLHDLELEQVQKVVAKRPERPGQPGQVLATWHGFQPRDHVMYVKLLPNPR